MFTGIITAIGNVLETAREGDALRLKVDVGELRGGLHAGDSLAVDGVCLTIETLDGARAGLFTSPETLSRTTLGELAPGCRVNLEPPLKAGQPLGGHFVQGHVDCTGAIASIREDGGGAWTFAFQYPPQLRDLLTFKGAIAVDGISLTIAALDEDEFRVAIIPYTYEHTTLQFKRPGGRVNLECDLIARQVRQYLLRNFPAELARNAHGEPVSRITAELLDRAGFMR